MSSDASLSEFQHASDMDAGPEHSTKHELTEWLEEHGAGVLWEESPMSMRASNSKV